MTDRTAAHAPDGASQLDETDDGVLAPRPLADRTLGRLLVVLGLVGFAGSLALAIERYLSLVDPDHQPTCSINALLTCSPAMASDAGSLLGFPNPYIGLGAFPVVVTIGVVLLAVPGIALPRWFWRTFLAVATAAMGLIGYLVYTSLEVLVALCPYCMVVWFATLPIFWFLLVRNVQDGLFGGTASAGIVRQRGLLLAAMFVGLLAWIVVGLGPSIAGAFA